MEVGAGRAHDVYDMEEWGEKECDATFYVMIKITATIRVAITMTRLLIQVMNE